MIGFSNHDLGNHFLKRFILKKSKDVQLSRANQYLTSVNNESFVLIGGSWLGMRRLEDWESQRIGF